MFAPNWIPMARLLIVAVSIAAGTIACGGCQSIDSNPETASSKRDPDWTSNLRAPGVGGEFLGSEERSRQIERNLGIQ